MDSHLGCEVVNDIQTAIEDFVSDGLFVAWDNKFSNSSTRTHSRATGTICDRAGNLANSYEIPSYVRLDSSIFYRQENWRVQLNFQNLFNTEYYLGSPNQDRLGVIPGAPFSVVGTLSVQF